MAHENKLTKTLRSAEPINDKKLNAYLARLDQPAAKSAAKGKAVIAKDSRAKVQTVSVYPEDFAVIQQLRRHIEDATGDLSVPISKIFRAALHAADNMKHFTEIYKNLK